ncbi:hypothetical protein L596_006955 [Steinernema carpocapsae]|uniref:Uncharacterized protein n=1 Tax=Steinernema carpocapsae TaxID=34508 RepID=A0A4V6XWJ3_STECR|nr:hypothetical protein L596_006955 [Steinernema carpocapsae]
MHNIVLLTLTNVFPETRKRPVLALIIINPPVFHAGRSPHSEPMFTTPLLFSIVILISLLNCIIAVLLFRKKSLKEIWSH